MADSRTEAKVAATAPLTEQQGSYVDWPAIIAGGVVASAIAAVFTAFGAALGLSTLSPFQNEGLGIWGVIIFGLWMLLTLIASYAAGGYIAGRMRRRMDFAGPDEVRIRDGLHGIVVWALGALVGFVLLGNAAVLTGRAAGAVVETTAEVAGSAISGAASGVATVAGQADDLAAYLPEGMNDDPLAYINSTLLRGTDLRLPTLEEDATDAPSAATRQVLVEILRTGEVNEDDREYLIGVVADRTSLTRAEVEEQVDAAIAKVQDLRAEAVELAKEAEMAAREAADSARVTAVITGFTLAAAMLIAAAAACIGAVIGGSHRDDGRFYGGFGYIPR